MRKLLYPIILLNILACNDSSKSSKLISTSTDSTVLDKVRWVMYALNYEQEPFNRETQKSINSIVLCSLYFHSIDTLSEDSISILGVFTDSENTSSRYELLHRDTLPFKRKFDINSCYGVIVYKGQISYIKMKAKPDSFNYPDSVSLYIKEHIRGFEEYLKNYSHKEEINSWLMGEAKKRKIIL